MMQKKFVLCLFWLFACGARQHAFDKSTSPIDVVRDLNSDAPCPHFEGGQRQINSSLVAAIAKSVDDDQVPIVKTSNAVEFGKAFADAKIYGDASVLLYNFTSGGGSVFWLSPRSSALFCVSFAREPSGNKKTLVRWIAFMQRH